MEIDCPCLLLLDRGFYSARQNSSGSKNREKTENRRSIRRSIPSGSETPYDSHAEYVAKEYATSSSKNRATMRRKLAFLALRGTYISYQQIFVPSVAKINISLLQIWEGNLWKVLFDTANTHMIAIEAKKKRAPESAPALPIPVQQRLEITSGGPSFWPA